MSQMIVLGQTVCVNCANCGGHTWRVSVMPGKQRLGCPCCYFGTIVEFYTVGYSDGTRLFKMDIKQHFYHKVP